MKTKHHHTLGLCPLRSACLLLLAAPLISAQSTPASPNRIDSDVNGEEVVSLSPFEVSAQNDDGYKAANAISGTRFNTALLDLPRPIDVITSEFIEDIGAKEIGEALRYSGGLSDNGTATPDDVTGNNFYNRGFQSFTSYRNGYRSFGVADTMFIDRVEIIKGPSSTFSGTIDPGGTMNMITKRPSAKANGYVRYRLGSYDRSRAEIFHTGPIDSGKKLRYLVGAAYEDYGSQYQFAGRQRKIYGGALQYDLTATTQLSFDMQYIDTKGVQANPLIVFNSAQTMLIGNIRRDFNRAGPGANSELTQKQLAVGLTQSLGSRWSFRAGGYFRSQDQDRITMGGSGVLTVNATTGARTVQRVPTWQDTSNRNFIVQASLLGDLQYGKIKHKVFAGFEYLGVVDQRNEQWQRATNNALPALNVDTARTAADFDIGTRSVYTRKTTDTMLDSIQRGLTVSNILQVFNDRMLFMQGYRFNTFYQDSANRLTNVKTSTTQDADVASYGVSYRIRRRWTAFVSYAESFSPQTASDFAGNLFKPITGKGWDLGSKFDLIEGKLSGTVVLFEIERSNVLQPDPDHPGYNISSGLDRSKGVEVNLIAKPLKGWQSVVSYANIDVKTIKDPTRPQNVGLSPPNVAHYQANFWNRYSFQNGPLKGFGAGVGVIYVGERRGNPNLPNTSAFRSPAYTRVDANLTYGRKIFGHSTNFSLALQNITDKDYFASYTALSEPFSVMGSVMVRF